MQNRIFLSPPHMGGDELKYVKEAFDSNYIAPLGEFVNRFENSISNYTGAKSALALSSGTAAIHLALRVLGIKQGDKVLASTFTFIGSVAPIIYQNAEPVFVDSDNSWNADPNLVEDAIKKEKPKAFIVTHLYGQSADIKSIAQICQRYGVVLIEDAAESLGAKFENKHTGRYGRFGIYSFNGNKIITTSGGGMLISDDERDIEYAKKLSTQAREPKLWYEHTEIGYNYRMSNILAAIGVGQMEVLDKRIARKREIFEIYKNALSDIDEIEWMPEIDGSFGNRWLTTMSLKESNPFKVIEALSKENIESRPLWKPMHLQKIFKDAKFYGTGVSEALFNSGVCLPSPTALGDKEIEDIASIIRRSVCNSN